MTDLQTVDEATFDEVVLHADKPVLVDFWAEWCPPCHQIAPVLAQIAAERNDQLTVVKLNSDENPAVPARYRVMALPTLILFHRGEMIWSVVGARPKAKLLKELDDALLAAVCPLSRQAAPFRAPSAGGPRPATHRWYSSRPCSR